MRVRTAQRRMPRKDDNAVTARLRLLWVAVAFVLCYVRYGLEWRWGVADDSEARGGRAE